MGRRNPFDIKAEHATNMGNTIGLWEERTENHFLGENIGTSGMRVFYVKVDPIPTSETPKAPHNHDQLKTHHIDFDPRQSLMPSSSTPNLRLVPSVIRAAIRRVVVAE